MIQSLPPLISALILISTSIIGFAGWGVFIAQILGRRALNISFAIAGWFGICMTIPIIEIVNLFIPIDWKVSFCYFFIGILFSINRYINLIRLKTFTQIRFSQGKLVLVIVGAIVFVGLTWISLAPTNHYDAGLYYVTTVKWLNESSFVFGLGNLHSRLAFNQSLFIVSALLNYHPFYQNGFVVSNLIFYFFTALTVIPLVMRLTQYRTFLFLLLLVLFSYTIYQPISPSPDFSILLIQLCIFILLLFITERNHSLDFGYYILLVALCVLGSTIKISILVFAFTSILVVVPTLWCAINQRRALSIRVLVFMSLVLIVHFLRGYGLSGYPLYPSAIGGAHALPWTLSPATLQGEIDWIYSWARNPHSAPDEVLGNWHWFQAWRSTLPLRAIFLAFGSGTLIAINITKVLTARAIESRRWWLIYLPLLASLSFWFFTAPDLRFLGSILELLFTLSVLISFLLFGRLFELSLKLANLALAPVAFVFFVLLMLYLLNLGTGTGLLNSFGIGQYLASVTQLGFSINTIALIFLFILYGVTQATINSGDAVRRYQDFFKYFVIIMGVTLLCNIYRTNTNNRQPITNRQLSTPVYTTKSSKSGVEINVPVTGDQCWNIPLPCTPYFNESLSISSHHLWSNQNIRILFTKN
jgi:hypothetical protein